MDSINSDVIHYSGDKPCGHCCAPAVWKFVDADGFNDFECDEHAREWWVSEMYNYDRSVEAMEFFAAQMEWQQAERDYKAAYAAFRAVDCAWASKEDYAVWSTAGYADSAKRAYMNVSIG